MSWKIAVPLGILAFGGIARALVVLEAEAPFQEKPSILLKASTGALPTANLPALLAEEDAKVQQAAEAAANAAAQVQALRSALGVTQEALQALDGRIQEKQATEWSAPGFAIR